MSDSWWRLPGPRHFLDAIIRDLEDGRSVIVRMPDHAPDAVRELDARLYDHQDLYRCLIPVDDIEPSLAREPYQAILHELGRDWAYPAPALALAGIPELSRRCFLVFGWDPLPLREWQSFMVEYATDVRGRRFDERAVFCLFLPAGESIPEEDITLAVHAYRGVVGAIDMALYLAPRVSARYGPGLERQLFSQLTGTLAGFDPLLGDTLLEHDLYALLDPMGLLAEFAAARGWTSGGPAKPDWCCGFEDIVEGRRHQHAGFLAAHGREDAIGRLIWEAEIAVVFPYLERLRVALVHDLNGRLIFPLKNGDGTEISDPCDLELGQLSHMARVRRIRGVTVELYNLLEDLTAARHSLAHLDPVPVDVLRRLIDLAMGRTPRLGLPNLDNLHS